MPRCGFLFAQSVVFYMLVATLLVGGVVRLLGRPASPVMLQLAIVFAISFPLLFAWRPPDSSSYGDALLGWPLTYAHAQSDAGLAAFRLAPFLTDFALGSVVGVIYILICRRNRNVRNA